LGETRGRTGTLISKISTSLTDRQGGGSVTLDFRPAEHMLAQIGYSELATTLLSIKVERRCPE
jgi:hypothetical protein